MYIPGAPPLVYDTDVDRIQLLLGSHVSWESNMIVCSTFRVKYPRFLVIIQSHWRLIIGYPVHSEMKWNLDIAVLVFFPPTFVLLLLSMYNYPSQTRAADAMLMLVYHLRRWPNMNITLVKCLVLN